MASHHNHLLFQARPLVVVSALPANRCSIASSCYNSHSSRPVFHRRSSCPRLLHFNLSSSSSSFHDRILLPRLRVGGLGIPSLRRELKTRAAATGAPQAQPQENAVRKIQFSECVCVYAYVFGSQIDDLGSNE